MNTDSDPYQAPGASLSEKLTVRPVGFWMRVVAYIIDTILIVLVILPILYLVYGKEYFSSTQLSHGALDFMVQYVLPFIAVMLFWVYKSATPGKMVINAKIVDAETGGKVPVARLVVRYFAYLIAMLPLLLGILWIAWDPRKQGWHDKIAGTMVVTH